MFARVARYRIPEDSLNRAVDAFAEAAEQLRELDGNTGGYVLIDRDNCTALTVTLWENRIAMEASEVRASRLRQEALRSVEGDIESVERLRVTTGIANEP
jgi:heme-degrading monooxygenase HmoA